MSERQASAGLKGEAPKVSRPKGSRPKVSRRRRDAAALLPLSLDKTDGEPLYRQLYSQLRMVVLEGRISPGTRLPSSRALAEELACSRNTIVNAYEQLLYEGYLEGTIGSGTYVSSELPDGLLSVGRDAAGAVEPAAPTGPSLSRRGAALAQVAREGRQHSGAFVTSVPDVGQFPFEVWGRLLGRIWRHPDPVLVRHGPTQGFLPLRQAIAAYLRTVRGLVCEPEQIFMTSGAQQGLDLTARLLLDPGDPVWFEEPGYLGLRGALVAAGARLVPVPIDEEGISVTAGWALEPKARMAAVTPSHQYPLGVTMSLSRRLALLDWAAEAGAWILEDDYDSEYRYAGRPLAALQGLEASRVGAGGSGNERRGAARVIYIGTFSKVMFPAMRLGYLVVPPDLVEMVTRARSSLDDYPSTVAQPALATFIEEGHFAAHIRRMRRLYAARQALLLEALERHCAGLLIARPDPAGLHLIADLAPELAARLNDREVSARAEAAGVFTPALSTYYLGDAKRQGLMLGYAAVPEAEIEDGARRLAAALKV